MILYTITFFFFNDTATTEIYTLSLHDALPISIPEIFTTKLWNGLIYSTDIDTWANWSIIFLVCCLICFSIFLITHSMLMKKMCFFAGIILTVGSILSFTCAYNQKNDRQNNREAIVFSPTVTIQSSPDENSTNLFVIHEGTKAKILETVNGWYRVLLANGNIGWLPTTSVKVI